MAAPWVAPSPSSRLEYNATQLRDIYDRIDLPAKFRYEPGNFSREVVRHHDGHGFLNALQRHVMATVPFENLDLHYSPCHQISIDPDAIFAKIVTGIYGAGRGGNCMEMNVFFGTLLRSAGFEVLSVGARVNHNSHMAGDSVSLDGTPAFGGWSHMVNLVSLRGEVYLVDVGFGSGCPTHPVPLRSAGVALNVPPDENIRVRWGAIPQHEDSANKLWIYERRLGSGQAWEAVYCFAADVEFLAEDLQMIHFFTSNSRSSLLTYRVICSRSLLDEKLDRIIGQVVLFENEVYQRVQGRKESLATFATEQDRVHALERYFEIKLTRAQQEGIRGMVTAIKP